MKKSKRTPSKSNRRKLERRKRERGAIRPSAESGESRAVETVTVIWVLTILNAFACELGALAVGAYARGHAEAPAAKMLSDLLLFAALVVGVISLGLLPIILKIRKTGPPTAVTVFAVLVGIAPIFTWVWMVL